MSYEPNILPLLIGVGAVIAIVAVCYVITVLFAVKGISFLIAAVSNLINGSKGKS